MPAVPEIGRAIPNLYICENGQMSWFFLCFFVSFGPEAVSLPCCLLSLEVCPENYD